MHRIHLNVLKMFLKVDGGDNFQDKSDLLETFLLPFFLLPFILNI